MSTDISGVGQPGFVERYGLSSGPERDAAAYPLGSRRVSSPPNSSESLPSVDPVDKPLEVLPQGTVVGRYVILQLLGHGAAGLVYAAYDGEDVDEEVLVGVGEQPRHENVHYRGTTP